MFLNMRLFSCYSVTKFSLTNPLPPPPCLTETKYELFFFTNSKHKTSQHKINGLIEQNILLLEDIYDAQYVITLHDLHQNEYFKLIFQIKWIHPAFYFHVGSEIVSYIIGLINCVTKPRYVNIQTRNSVYRNLYCFADPKALPISFGHYWR